MTTEELIMVLRGMDVACPQLARNKAANIIEQQAKEAETNVLNICQQQHTIAELVKELDGLRRINTGLVGEIKLHEVDLVIIHKQAKEIEELKEKCAYMAKYKVYEEVTTLRTQNERLVKALEWFFDCLDSGILVRDTTHDGEKSWPIRMMRFVRELEEAKTLLAEVRP